jgi:hypothetical protein
VRRLGNGVLDVAQITVISSAFVAIETTKTITNMDLALIAGAAIGAITPYLTKGGEALAEEAGKSVWELIKKPFTSDKDKALIGKLEANPADPRTQGKVEQKLEDLLEQHPEIAEQLNGLLVELGQGTQVHHNTATTTGDGNITVQDASGATITVRRY